MPIKAEEEVGMRVLQVATTHGVPCGIGNFAMTLAAELHRQGLDVETVASLDQRYQPPDVTVIHHHSILFDDAALNAIISRCSRPIAIFAHSPGAEGFESEVDGFIAMSDGAVRGIAKPRFVFPHPAWIPSMLTSRDEIRSQLGLPVDRVIIGTSGFLTPARHFPELLGRLLPAAIEGDWLITLTTSHRNVPFREVEEDLAGLAAEYPDHLTYGAEFLPVTELNYRLQACDLLWCWTDTPSEPYASGSVSDQYASGIRLIVDTKRQHQHILRLPNVVAAPNELHEFGDCVIREARSGHFPRHDPAPVSWAAPAQGLTDFLIGLTRRDVGQGVLTRSGRTVAI